MNVGEPFQDPETGVWYVVSREKQKLPVQPDPRTVGVEYHWPDDPRHPDDCFREGRVHVRFCEAMFWGLCNLLVPYPQKARRGPKPKYCATYHRDLVNQLKLRDPIYRYNTRGEVIRVATRLPAEPRELEEMLQDHLVHFGCRFDRQYPGRTRCPGNDNPKGIAEDDWRSKRTGGPWEWPGVCPYFMFVKDRLNEVQAQRAGREYVRRWFTKDGLWIEPVKYQRPVAVRAMGVPD